MEIKSFTSKVGQEKEVLEKTILDICKAAGVPTAGQLIDDLKKKHDAFETLEAENFSTIPPL